MASAYQDDFKLGRNSQIDFNAEEYNGETPIMLAVSLLHFKVVEILLSDPRVIIEGLEKYVGIKIKGRKDDKQRMVDMVKKEAAHRLAQPKTQERPMVATDFIKEEHITKKSDEHNDQDGLTFTIDSRPEKVLSSSLITWNVKRKELFFSGDFNQFHAIFNLEKLGKHIVLNVNSFKLGENCNIWFVSIRCKTIILLSTQLSKNCVMHTRLWLDSNRN